METVEWRLIRDGARDGATQMALEEVAARTAAEEGLGTVRVYDWAPSTVTLGYQQAVETIDRSYCDQEGIGVTRRQTGGGGIYHDDHGDIAYTVVAPKAAVPADLMACYEQFCAPVLSALEEVGVAADFADEPAPPLFEPSCYLRDVHPAHDVVVAGRKVSGNAQYRQRDAVIQHGSITYEQDPEGPLAIFTDHDCSVTDYRKRVTSIREHSAVSREAVRDALATELASWCDATEGEWRESERERANELAAAKYASESWIADRTDPTTDRALRRG